MGYDGADSAGGVLVLPTAINKLSAVMEPSIDAVELSSDCRKLVIYSEEPTEVPWAFVSGELMLPDLRR